MNKQTKLFVLPNQDIYQFINGKFIGHFVDCVVKTQLHHVKNFCRFRLLKRLRQPKL